MNDTVNENNDANDYRINNKKTITSKSFEYKKEITRKTLDDENTLEEEVAFPLKLLSNFWKIHLEFRWIKNCIISEMSRAAEEGEKYLVDSTKTNNSTFQINNTTF